MRYWFTLLLLSYSGSVLACRAEALQDAAQKFSSVDAFLKHAQQLFARRSAWENAEYFGAIVLGEGGVRGSAYRGCPGRDGFTLRVPRRHPLVAVWHTHGSWSDAHRYFSLEDAELVRRIGKPLYLLAADGEIRVLEPRHVARAPDRLRLWRSIGARLNGYIGSVWPQASSR